MDRGAWLATVHGVQKSQTHTHNYFIIYQNVIMIEIKCTINVMKLNHPKTITPPLICGKFVLHKLVPGAKNVGDHHLT